MSKFEYSAAADGKQVSKLMCAVFLTDDDFNSSASANVETENPPLFYESAVKEMSFTYITNHFRRKLYESNVTCRMLVPGHITSLEVYELSLQRVWLIFI